MFQLHMQLYNFSGSSKGKGKSGGKLKMLENRKRVFFSKGAVKAPEPSGFIQSDETCVFKMCSMLDELQQIYSVRREKLCDLKRVG